MICILPSSTNYSTSTPLIATGEHGILGDAPHIEPMLRKRGLLAADASIVNIDSTK
jgi:hypothetical protein